jgi:hypothetical protein
MDAAADRGRHTLPQEVPLMVRSGATVTRLLCFRYQYTNVLKYRTRQNVGGISILFLKYKMYQRVPPTYCRVRYSGSGYGTLSVRDYLNHFFWPLVL